MSTFDVKNLNNENNDIINNIENNNDDDDNDDDYKDTNDINDTKNDDNMMVQEKNIEIAQKAKDDGNILYKSGDYDGALQYYSEAVAYCPTDDHENMSIFLGNRAATYFTIKEFECVIEDCTQSLVHKPDYVKVLMRRCQAYEKTNKIDEALADAKKVQELDSSYPKINDIVKKLEKEYEEKMNKMKEEALGKLKELGNSILGNFGMSLDNFKMQQDPNTGSWSISMNQGNK